MKSNYLLDREFLTKYIEVIELSNGDKRVIVTPNYQGRVMTSSAAGDEGYSFGWINYKLIESQQVLPHCNNWGGEDRFWLGPEGGQYAVFFAPGTSDKFDFEDWQALDFVDTKGWQVVERKAESAKFATSEKFQNWSGAEFSIDMEREVRLLNDAQVADMLGIALPDGVESVGFESLNTIKNVGDKAWNKEQGALSIWMLGQFKPSDDNEIIIPVKECGDTKINSNYFGEIEESRLSRKGNLYHFKGDGNKRGKLGTPPEITIPTVFALDRVNQILTIVKFSFEEDAKEYLNAMWKMQDEPFKGDVINSYNDGPLEDGTVMGGFYEIESSSKALFLAPSESHTHSSVTIHVKGDIETLNSLLATMSSQL